MKRNTVYAFFISLALLLSACGSNSKSDRSLKDLEGVKVFTAEAGRLKVDANLNFSTSIPFKKLEGNDVSVEFSNFNLALTGCELDGSVTYSPNPLALDGGKDSQKSITVSGKVKNECNATAYKLSADKKVTLEGESETITGVSVINAFLDANGNPTVVQGPSNPTDPNTPTVDGDFSFFNVPSSFVISKINTKTSFKLQVIDKAKRGVSGKEIYIETFANKFGEVSPSSVITDSDGYANFVYTSPSDLAPVDSQTLVLKVVYDENGTQVDSANITLSFNASTTTPNSYKFENAESIDVRSAGEEKIITVDLVDSLGVGVSGKEISITKFPPSFGSVKQATVSTIEGTATFNYTAPLDLTTQNGNTQDVNLIFKDEDGNLIVATVSIEINATSVGGVTYTMINETTPIEIKYINQVETISVKIVDSSKVGVPGKTVLLSAPDFGALTASTAITNAAGLAEFSYTAPSSLAGLGTTVVTLIMEDNGITITKDVSIKVVPAPVGSSDFNLTNASTPIEIGFAKEIKEIRVQLVKNGTPQIGKTVTAKSIPASFGSIANVNVVTGTDGYARFTYVAADPLVNGTQALELYYDDSLSGERVSTSIDISVLEQPTISPQINIITEAKDGNLTGNNSLVKVQINVFKNGAPYSEGTVKVSIPPEAITSGIDVGHFDAYEVSIENGQAEFNYIGPNNLQGLIDAGYLGSTFNFFHSESLTNQKAFTMVYSPDPTDTYIPVNYTLDVSSIDGNMTMGIEEEKTFSVTVLDDQNNNVPADSNFSIKLTSKNLFIGKLLDNGVQQPNITSIGKNPLNFNVRTDTKSGLLPIEIEVTFTTINNEIKTLRQTINIVVFSGPPTALSISYVGVEQDKDAAKFIEKFAITAVDRYNNRVNTNPNIALGGMSGYAPDGNSVNRLTTQDGGVFPRLTSDFLYHGATKTGGDVTPLGGNIADFKATDANAFQYINTNLPNERNDYLATFGLGYVYEALGKWDVTPDASSDLLHLDDDYYGSLRRGLYYAMGHNFRDDPCNTDGREWVGFAESDTYQLNDEGTVIAKFKYDYYLTGKDVLVWVNLTGFQADTNLTTRIGEVTKHTLRGMGLYASPDEGYKIPGAGSVIYPIFHIRMSETTEAYKNGHFGGVLQVSGEGCSASIVDSSNSYDARYCYKGSSFVVSDDDDNNATTPDINRIVSTRQPVLESDGSGQGWLQVKASCTGPDGGIVKYDKVLVSDEF